MDGKVKGQGHRSLNTYLDFYKIDGFHKTWLSGEYAGVQYTSCGWDDLTASSVDCISVKCHVVNVEADSAHVFFAHYSLWKKTTNLFMNNQLISFFLQLVTFC